MTIYAVQKTRNGDLNSGSLKSRAEYKTARLSARTSAKRHAGKGTLLFPESHRHAVPPMCYNRHHAGFVNGKSAGR